MSSQYNTELPTFFTNYTDNNPNNMPNLLTELLQTSGVNMNNFLSPRVDIIENDTFIIIYMEIPGIPDESIQVDFFNNQLKIRADNIKPYDNRYTVKKNEIIYGPFEKIINIPICVTSRESVNIKAEYGVMKIEINKLNENRNRFSVRVSQTENTPPPNSPQNTPPPNSPQNSPRHPIEFSPPNSASSNNY